MKNLSISNKGRRLRVIALLLVVCMLPVFGMAEESASSEDWRSFLLICNEGMLNDGGNVGSTMSVVAINKDTGIIRLMMFTWDTFVEYEGYDVPQKIDMAYRNNGPEETMKVFNQNFGLSIDTYLSLNYSNLASLIDAYGGIEVNVSRAERNALNSMVGSKKDALMAEASSGFVSQLLIEMLAQDYVLNDFGPDTHLNGLQAVGYGWLQYDSVYNCCQRDGAVISNLFESVAESINEKVIYYNNESGVPTNTESRRAINIDNITDEDIAFMYALVSPIFQMSNNNLTEQDIEAFTVTFARAAYRASRQGVDIFDSVQIDVKPLEALQPYDHVAGTEGHLIDYAANREAMIEFLYGDHD